MVEPEVADRNAPRGSTLQHTCSEQAKEPLGPFEMETGAENAGLRTLLARQRDDAAFRQFLESVDALQMTDPVGFDHHE